MKINKTIYQVDAFADEPFRGNPAGVMIVDEHMSSERMQSIAMEMNLSETAFIMPMDGIFRIRYFSPTKEVPLCGHATLASAHILYEFGFVDKTDPIIFQAQSETLNIAVDNELITMKFPKYFIEKTKITKNFNEIIGFEPIEAYKSEYDWIIAVAASEDDITHAKPNFDKMIDNGLGHLMITAKSTSFNSDFVVRCFAPQMGINEDPVTGSAHCALAPLWVAKLGKSEMDSIQLSKRSGKIKVKLAGDKVEIKGAAVTIFEAELVI